MLSFFPCKYLQIRMVRGDFVDESGSPLPDWIGLIRAARNSQEQNLEAVSDLPGGQVRITKKLSENSICIILLKDTFSLVMSL